MELANNVFKQFIEIIGILDHKICHKNENELEYHQFHKYTLITSSALRNLNNETPGGVGILVSKTVENALTDIIVHFAPLEGKPDSEEHYKNIPTVAASIPKVYIPHDSTNKNGQPTVDFAEEANILVTNNYFRKKTSKQCTYISHMNGVKSQVHYILIGRK